MTLPQPTDRKRFLRDMQHMELVILARDLIKDHARPVHAAIVDRDDVKARIFLLGDALDTAGDAGLLILGRHEDRYMRRIFGEFGDLFSQPIDPRPPDRHADKRPHPDARPGDDIHGQEIGGAETQLAGSYRSLGEVSLWHLRQRKSKTSS